MNDTELRYMCNKYLIYNPLTGVIIYRISRGGWKAGSMAGTIGSTGYRTIRIDCTNYRSHRVGFLMHHGHLPKMIDHINGDKLDNRINNLRECTASQNMRNREGWGASKFAGVSWFKRDCKWKSQIRMGNKRIHLGYFDSEGDAATAYVDAAKRFGLIEYIRRS